MDKILILDFGGQYNQLIARRVREAKVYCELHSYKMSLEEIKSFDPKGIIFTGGPKSVYAEGSPHPAEGIFELGVPILGICYGCQLLAHHLGGRVVAAEDDAAREYGKTLTSYRGGALFRGLPKEAVSWMSHGDYMEKIPEGFVVTALSAACPNVAIEDEKRKFYGVQFHPEVNHTEHGSDMIRNFLNICGVKREWTMEGYMKKSMAEIREKVGNGRVLLALSGGVDSSVCAALLAEAVGSQLSCVFVDHGLMRKNEGREVEHAFEKWDINFVKVDAEKRFLEKLKGVEEPEKKRKIIGEEFIRVFEEEAKKIGRVDYLAQGTIYPDVVESGYGGESSTIKSHHNVGGLPDYVDFKEIIEPLRLLFKDEVRELGRELGLPEYLVSRQPFPGPGLGVRIIGEVTKEKCELLREADYIFREEIAKAGLERSMSQYFAALTNMRSVGVMGDGRSYDYAVALRSVLTSDFMTAEWVRIPYEVLDRVSSRIVNEVPGVNRVLYDITGKPPATIELE